MTIDQSVALAVAILAAATDLRSRRIPNMLTFGAALVAFVLHAFISGWTGLGLSLAGWLVGAAFFFPFFALGGMGAGDVKLVGALGACLGPATAVWLALYSSIVGGVMAIGVAVFSGYFRTAFSNLWGLLMFWRVVGIQPAPDLMLTSQRGPRLAYAVPVLAGLMVTLWWR
jgi:prepilin peptidase CpaA